MSPEETRKKFLRWLKEKKPDLPAIQRMIGKHGIDIHAAFEWKCDLAPYPCAGDPSKVQSNLLHIAIKYQDPSLVRWLIDQKLDVNAPLLVAFDHGKPLTPYHTPLSMAAQHLMRGEHYHPEIIEMLLAAGAGPNFTVGGYADNTALHACVFTFYPMFDSLNHDEERIRKTLASLLRAGADPAPVMNVFLEIYKYKKTAILPAREHPTDAVLRQIEGREKRLASTKEALHLLLQHQAGRLIFAQQEGRRLFAAGDEAVAALAQHCLIAEAPDLAALIQEGSKPAPDFPALVEHCFNAGMAEMAVSLFAPGKWPDKLDLLHAYDEALPCLQPERSAFLQNQIDMTPIRREHTGRHGSSWLARYSKTLQEQAPMAEPQR